MKGLYMQIKVWLEELKNKQLEYTFSYLHYMGVSKDVAMCPNNVR